MFASKLQDGTAEVTAISHNSKKKDDALKMGAKHFLDTSNPEQLKAAARSFDYVLCTANGKQQDYNAWLSTIKLSVDTRHTHAGGKRAAQLCVVTNEARVRSVLTLPLSCGSLLFACACFSSVFLPSFPCCSAAARSAPWACLRSRCQSTLSPWWVHR
jgi:hypothetical protein